MVVDRRRCRVPLRGLSLEFLVVRFPSPEVVMIPTLVEQYRRWVEYEKDSHRKVLASFETVPEAGRRSEPFQKAMNIVAHMVAARQTWLHRFGAPVERPAHLFPTDATYDGLLAEL